MAEDELTQVGSKGGVMAISCTQCDTPAIVQHESGPLCVRHYLMFQQASWIQFAQWAAMLNETKGQIAQGTGHIVPPNYIQIPPPPSLGDHLTFNNIKVTDSSVGLINTGTIKRIESLDASVTKFAASGKAELSESLQSFTQLLFDSPSEASVKDEIAQQVEYLVAQAQAEPIQRSKGIIKSVLEGIERTTTAVPPLAKAWDNLQPMLKEALQVMS